jgi:predicted nucleic acid-binding protein
MASEVLFDTSGFFSDCLSFCVMKERAMHEALTTDEHFLKAGFSALLISVPDP